MTRVHQPLRLPLTSRSHRGGLDLGGAAASRPARRRRWLAAGVLLGLSLSLLANLPAAWLADELNLATRGRLQLIQAEGTVWTGSALPMLTGGPGSRDASALPSRLSWTLRPMWDGLRLRLSQECCMQAGVDLELRPGWGRLSLAVLPLDATVGQWPARWLEGLGAPWNTIKLGGQVRLATHQLGLSLDAGIWQMRGQAELSVLQASSRLSMLDPLGSYQLTLTSAERGPIRLSLHTLDGALQFSGQGELRPGGVQFRGQAQAQPGQEAALNNLLNIIGRRQGALSVISIG
jgi:general secretion pathway protein N